jgi:hypothetical protein
VEDIADFGPGYSATDEGREAADDRCVAEQGMKRGSAVGRPRGERRER